MDLLAILCAQAGYTPVATNLGIVKVVSTGQPAPYIEGEITDVLRRLVRLTRNTTH